MINALSRVTKSIILNSFLIPALSLSLSRPVKAGISNSSRPDFSKGLSSRIVFCDLLDDEKDEEEEEEE